LDMDEDLEPAGLLEIAGTRPLARPTVAVLLAAGRSERMLAVTRGGSKALVRIGGLTLLEHAIRTIERCGIERVIVVVGHHGGPVATIARAVAPGLVQICYAEEWREGNGASLLAAEPYVTDEPSFLLVTVDHVFQEGTLEALMAASSPSVLVDANPGSAAWDEGTRVRMHGSRAVGFSKELEDPSIDCGAFVLTPGIFDAQKRAAARGSHSLAEAVTEFAADVPLEAVEIGRSWWLDVDTPTDLRRARAMIRRSLGKGDDGPVSSYLNRPLSTRISMRLARMRPSPDLVTWVVLGITMVAAYALLGSHGLLGGLLVQTVSVLDGVDGELSRLELRSTLRGAFLDGVFDRIGDAAILVGLCVWAIHEGHSAALVAALGVVASAGSMLSMAVKDRARALGLRPAPERALSYLLGGRDGRLLLIAIASVAGQPLVGVAAVAGTSALALILRVGFVVGRSSRKVEATGSSAAEDRVVDIGTARPNG
jgi:choline kinase/phosphatidylglycerophosphate synthase